MHKIENLGQVFTPDFIVNRMISLIQNKGTTLEPAAGNGMFYNNFDDIFGIEIDPDICLSSCLNIDFFDYPTDNKFNTIIGNPPFVAFNSILKETQQKLSGLPKRSNLYLFFIDKCLKHLSNHGELIFITPRDFIKSTSAININNLLYNTGTITHFFDLGDESIFGKYTPNCAIWRFEKDNFTRKTETNNGIRNFQNINGQLCFTKEDHTIPFKDLFFVKVGGVCGHPAFISELGNKSFVCSYTNKTGKLKKMIYNLETDLLLPYKEELLNRKVKKVNESNWWSWGRDYYKSELKRVYVNCKTRNDKPFFTHECRDYDGSVLAVFIKGQESEEEVKDKLNAVNWDELGFKVGGRYMFTQRSLEEILLPKGF